MWETRALVKTFGPRGTVHLLPTGTSRAGPPRWPRCPGRCPFDPSVRLAPAQLDEVVAGIGAVLADAELTIDELDAALADEVGGWAVERCMPAFQELWPRWRQAVDTAANRGVLCFGPVPGPEGHLHQPAAVVARVRAGAGAGGGDLAGPLVPALVRAGPAGAPRAVAGRREAVGGDAVRDAHLGRRDRAGGAGGLGVAGDTAFPPEAPRGLRLLPYFDAYVVGSHPRDQVFPGAAAARAQARRQAGNFPVLLLDGVVGGVWHQKRSGRYVDVTVEPLAELSAARRRDLEAETERIGAFVGLTPRLTVGPVTVGPHA